MTNIPQTIRDFKKNTVCRRVENEMVLVPLVNEVAEMKVIFTLNEVAAFIWEQLDEVLDVEELAQKIAADFDVDMLTATNDINSFFNDIINKAQSDD